MFLEEYRKIYLNVIESAVLDEDLYNNRIKGWILKDKFGKNLSKEHPYIINCYQEAFGN
jgi:hypothetical protein